MPISGAQVGAAKQNAGPAAELLERLRATARTLVYALGIALAVRTILYEPFNIPSGSMEPTLLVGDYLSCPSSLRLEPATRCRSARRCSRAGIAAERPSAATSRCSSCRRDPHRLHQADVGLPGDKLQVDEASSISTARPFPRAGPPEHVETSSAPATARWPAIARPCPERAQLHRADILARRRARRHPVYRGPRGPRTSRWATTATTRWTAGRRRRVRPGREPGRAGQIMFFSTNGSARLVGDLEMARRDSLSPAVPD